MSDAEPVARTTLDEREYQACLKKALIHLRGHDSIRNRELRHLSGIGYDQAIKFFNRAILERTPVRHGSGGSTTYRVPGLGKHPTV
jgi:hypothetical protein